jgi:hypothetical protein
VKQFLANRIQTLQALFVWSIWALMLLAAVVVVWVKGSPFPKADDWEMIPALTGHQPDMLPWLWSQHGYYQDGQIIEGQINEHRNALGRVIILGLLYSTNGDFRSGMMFSALALGALAAAMIWTAKRLRGYMHFADAFFPLALLHWGHAGCLLWCWQLSFALVAVLAGMLLIIIVRCRTPFGPGITTMFALCLVLLALSDIAGLSFVGILALGLGFSGFLHWRSAEPSRRRLAFFTLALVLGCLSLIPLYFVGFSRPDYLANPESNTVHIVTTSAWFLSAGFGPFFLAWSWPYTGFAVCGLLLAGVVAGVWLIGKKPEERFRMVEIVAFVGAVMALGLAVGRGRGYAAAEGVQGYLDNVSHITFLAIPGMCCLYLPWLIYRSPLTMIVQTCLFGTACIALPFNMDFDFSPREPEVFEEDLQTGMPPSILAERNWRRGCPDPTIGPEYLASRLYMLKQAGIQPYKNLPEDAPLREVSLPARSAVPSTTSVDSGMADGSGDDSALTFTLRRPTWVKAIRMKCSYRANGGGLRVFWRESVGGEFTEARLPADLDFEARQEETITLWVDNRINQIRICPGSDPSMFTLAEVTLAEP